MLPIGSSDLAVQVWEWILADPEAAAWLAGTPDEWGMVVNPVYNTTASNSSGIPFAATPPDSFSKADPYCFQEGTLASGVVPPPLCALDWMPYADSFHQAAHFTSTANDLAKTELNTFAGLVTDVWKRAGAQTFGFRTMLGLTDLPSATNLGLQSAKLSRAGDNGADRKFIAPDAEGLGRAVHSMREHGGMVRLDPADVDLGAYPLATITYAAVRPFANDDNARADYAALLDYAAGPGQVPGRKLGQLPPGYLPLSEALAQRTAGVADALRTLKPEKQPSSGGTTSPPGADGESSDPGSSDFGSLSGQGGTNATASGSGAGAAGAPSGDDDDATKSAQQVSQRTPALALGVGRYALLAAAVLALAAALAALEVTKRPFRRSRAGAAPTDAAGAQA
jgi:hypothetical protein